MRGTEFHWRRTCLMNMNLIPPPSLCICKMSTALCWTLDIIIFIICSPIWCHWWPRRVPLSSVRHILTHSRPLVLYDTSVDTGGLDSALLISPVNRFHQIILRVLRIPFESGSKKIMKILFLSNNNLSWRPLAFHLQLERQPRFALHMKPSSFSWCAALRSPQTIGWTIFVFVISLPNAIKF